MALTAVTALVLAVLITARPSPAAVTSAADANSISSFGEPVVVTFNGTNSTRDYLTNMVVLVLDSMVAGNPDQLPLGHTYKATENGHPAALVEMTAWRTITKVVYTDTGVPNLLAIDTKQAQAYFALDVSEGNDNKTNVLWGRIKVVNTVLTELEFYINRGRGDHGFSFSSEDLAENYKIWNNPPANRVRADRETLDSLAAASFNTSNNFTVNVADDCQFTEAGWLVQGAGCAWVDYRPDDPFARALVIDEVYGIVVTAGVVPGKVYPYATFSAFIPNSYEEDQKTQDTWYTITKNEGYIILIEPMAAIGTTFQVMQYYNDSLQGLQNMIYLSPPLNGSAWE